MRCVRHRLLACPRRWRVWQCSQPCGIRLGWVSRIGWLYLVSFSRVCWWTTRAEPFWMDGGWFGGEGARYDVM
ncbi:hypothetical protein LX36DRAFT_162325 [Colletotrichum falcatum]|nr:hypothetical protein LX36DRAFT_162325 [Colletotrichum falcatum]